MTGLGLPGTVGALQEGWHSGAVPDLGLGLRPLGGVAFIFLRDPIVLHGH
jgi:hypothetical protein